MTNPSSDPKASTVRRLPTLKPSLANEQTQLIVLAVALGVAVGFGALGFGYLLNLIQSLVFHREWSFEHVDDMPSAVKALPWYWIMLAPALGGLIVGPLVTRFASEAKGHGIPEVMEAVALRGGRIRKRVALVKIFASACTIGTGGSAGKEGPIGQIGAALGSALSQVLKLSRDHTRTLVACGAAGGIAATFNAPIAGSLFAVEVILGGFGVASLSPIILCAVMATVTARAFHGDVLLLNIPEAIKETYNMVSPFEVITYCGLGIAAALVAMLYIKTLYVFEDLADGIKKIPAWLRPAVGGLAVGAFGIALPGVMAQGFETIEMSLVRTDEVAWTMLIALLLAKIVATSLTLGSGGSGGVFAPSLVIGAMLGCAYGKAAHTLFPNWTAEPGAYALVGMGAVVAAATHAPISSILILFEMTDNYRIILPLMLAAVVGTVVSSQSLKVSIYTLKLKRRGVELRAGFEEQLLRSLSVELAQQTNPSFFRDDTTFRELLKRMLEGDLKDYPVLDAQDRLVGTVSFDTVREFVFEEGVRDLIIARELMNDKLMTLTPDDSLSKALDVFAAAGTQEVPIVDSKDPQRLVGLLSRRQVMDTYRRELRKLSTTSPP